MGAAHLRAHLKIRKRPFLTSSATCLMSWSLSQKRLFLRCLTRLSWLWLALLNGCPGWDRTNGPFSGGLRRGNFFGEHQNHRRTTERTRSARQLDTARTGTLKPRKNHSRVAVPSVATSDNCQANFGQPCKCCQRVSRSDSKRNRRRAPLFGGRSDGDISGRRFPDDLTE